jgi:radical SAM protein with 4Fe4S-binding SPASM domain
MVNITRESGLDEIRIILERNIPGYEKIVYPIHSFIFDKMHKSSVNSAIKNIMLMEKFPLFQDIEIETINRCNGNCSFCPVNKNIDPRNVLFMKDSLFYNIIDQLKKLEFKGTVCFNLNNEPLLDKRLEDFLAFARSNLPECHFLMCTNGILLTIEKFNNIIKYLDELLIDNYNDKRELNEPVKKILDHLNLNPEFSDRVRINIVRKDAIRTTRGGLAHNRSKVYFLKSSCIYPFWQINIRPDGKVSLCCNDALGTYTLGDLNDQTLDEIWNGEAYWNIRKQIIKGRQHISMCKRCDTFLFFPPYLYKIKKILSLKFLK